MHVHVRGHLVGARQCCREWEGPIATTSSQGIPHIITQLCFCVCPQSANAAFLQKMLHPEREEKEKSKKGEKGGKEEKEDLEMGDVGGGEARAPSRLVAAARRGMNLMRSSTLSLNVRTCVCVCVQRHCHSIGSCSAAAVGCLLYNRLIVHHPLPPTTLLAFHRTWTKSETTSGTKLGFTTHS